MLGCMLQHDVLNTCFFILLFFCAVLKRMKEIVVLLESQEFTKQFYNIPQFFYVFKYFHVIGMKDKKAQIIFDFRFLGFLTTQKLAAHSIDLLFSPQIPNSRMIHLCLPC